MEIKRTKKTFYNKHPFSVRKIQMAFEAVSATADSYNRLGSIVVVDNIGEILASYRMPGASAKSYQIAKKNALNIVGIVKHNQSENLSGGFPILKDEQVIGGVAFSSYDPMSANALSEEDIHCTRAASAVLTEGIEVDN